jgi:tetratricopeptide (TPR) repeat protein
MHRLALLPCLALLRVLTAMTFVWLASAPVAADTPLYEEDPYDQITLDAQNRNAVLKVKPLELPTDKTRKPQDKLQVHLLDRPDAVFELTWRSIVKIEHFEQLLLDKANQLVAEGKYDEAYDHFHFLELNRPNARGLGEAMENYLYEEAKQSQRRQRYDEVLALLSELHRRNPKRAGLGQVLGSTTDKLIDRYMKAGDYPSARQLLGGLATPFPDHTVVHRWEDQFKREAAALRDQAQAAADAGRLPEAALLSRRFMAIWPRLAGGRELAEAIYRRYPRVVVGVATPATSLSPNRPQDWAARRAGRLLYRTLTEFAGSGVSGGDYQCPVGQITSEALGRRLIIQLKPDIRWAEGKDSLTGLDVSCRLLAMADAADSAYRPDWADLLAATSVQKIYRVEAELRRAHVRPEALLQTILTPRAETLAAGELPPANGPFQMTSRNQEETLFTANPRYFAAQAGQPQEIVERPYPSFPRAIAALRRGEIQVLDRVSPWNLAAARAEKSLTVKAYSLPLVHCLVPNHRRPLTADRTFRRAVAYGIHRQMILDQMLDGVETPGCRVASGPFPIGTGVDDPIGYALDPSIEPRPYEPRLAIALAGVALQNTTAEQLAPGKSSSGKSPGKPASKPVPTIPPLVLAYPSDEVAQGACASIKRQLALLGISIELQVIKGPLPQRIPDQVDLLYVELAVWEPLTDARRLLGEDGLAGGCSPYMSLALRQLDEATDWTQVRQRLRKIHRLVHDETAVVPLWQLTDHFVHHQSLQGILSQPVSLYQHVEQWRPALQYPFDPKDHPSLP